VSHLLDTDTCVWLLRQREPVFSRVRQRPAWELAISSMTAAELRFGSLKSNDPRGNLEQLERLLSVIAILPFERTAARVHAELRYHVRAQPIGDRDLVIASVALAEDLTLVTHNQREFGRVPTLRLDDWFIP
jgi:tRNA(fMet)-specific endonuclease VapC